MQKSLFTFFALIILTTAASAQGVISGSVNDVDGLVLVSANIFVEELDRGATTNNNGDYIITGIPEGEYQVKVSYIGYQTQTETVQVSAGGSVNRDFVLESGVIVGDEVVILGERLKGQAKSFNQQRENYNITNVVSADQMGRFPDANIGDALKRIPAITVGYDQGEARFVNIRGTEPRLNSITINGERVPSAEGDDRINQVDLIPSDMIQTIEVNKAITPDMDADAIGGSINLVTRAAPGKLRFSGTLGSGVNFLTNQPIWTGSLVFGQRFLDGKIGMVVSGSYHDHYLGSDNTEGQWEDFDGVISPEEWEVRQYLIRRARRSVSANFDFQLSPRHNIRLGGIYNHRDDWENRYRIEVKDILEPGANGVTVAEEMAREVKGGINNDTNNSARLEDQRMMTFSLGGDHNFGDGIKADWSVNYAKASEERPNERYLVWVVENVDLQLDLSEPENPYWSYLNPSQVDIDNWELDELTEEYQWTEEKDLAMRMNVELPLVKEGDYKNSLKIGGKYRTKDKERDNEFWEYSPEGDFLETMNQSKYSDRTDADFLAGDYQLGNITTADFLGDLNLEDSNLFEKEDKPDEYIADNYTATEKVTAGYIMLTQQLGPQWSVLGGVRIEKTELENTGNEWNDDEETSVQTSGEGDYTNILPALHVKYTLDPNTIIRAAWTNTIARPNYYDLVAFRAIEDDEIEVGNPELDPTTSMNFDLMAEHYFENVGILSGGFFYKSINDFIYIHGEEDYVEPGTGIEFDEYFQPRNGAEATLFGIEFALQRKLDFMPGILKNLNFYSNYTYTSSSADNPNYETDEDIELPGTAEHTLNAALSYDTPKLTLTVSFNYSSPYLDPDDLILTPGLERYYDTVTYLDISGSYQFIEQASFYFELNNLLNQPLRYYAGVSSRTYQAEFYNARFSAGVKFSL